MSVPIGFVLLVNPRNPLEQTARLIWTLNRLFDDPPIACHHDFGQNPQFIADCPANVKLVQPHVATKWGDFSCVEAFLKALRLLYSPADSPEWFVFLSGSDYPIKPADTILRDLQEGGYDGYIEHALVSEGDLVYPPDPENRQGWKWETWLHQCHKRYCSLRVDVPGLNRYLRPSKRTLWLEQPWLASRFLPFSSAFKCYAGEVWFTANRRCATRLLDFARQDEVVAAHYRKTLVPEESYPQTVLGNTAELRLSQQYLRFIDWTERKSNPRILTMKDLPSLLKTQAHFARKFDAVFDGKVLDELDRAIGL